MSKVLTARKALESLKRVVAKPDHGSEYVYRNYNGRDNNVAGLFYAYSHKDGTPSCIVGHVLADTVPDLYGKVHEFEVERGTTFTFTVNGGGGATLGIHDYLTPGAVRVLRRAQEQQDEDETWGAALIAANIEALRLFAIGEEK